MRPTRNRPARPLAALALAALALTVAGCGAGSEVAVGRPIPEFTAPDLDGTEVTSTSLAGSPVVLNFWATWCGPCVQEIPALQAIARGGAARVVAIAIDDDGESVVRPFVERHGIDYTVLLGDPEIASRFGVYAIPYTLVLDPSLRVVTAHRGLIDVRTLERDLRRAQP